MKIESHNVMSLLDWPAKAGQGMSLYQLIYNKIKTCILTGDLPDRCELPPTRILSKDMSVSRSTIIKVYDLLKLEGLIESTMGSGYRVLTPKMSNLPADPDEKASHYYVSISEGAEAFHSNVGLINAIDDPGIAFRPGIPPLDVFPIIKWKKLSDEYWKFVRASELSYYAGAGVEVLRKTIANYLNLRRNARCNHEQVFIVSGSLQSLYLIGNLLINPGDTVIAENPTFPNVHSVFKSLRANVSGITLDVAGMDANMLEDAISPKTKLLHLTPSCHYPLGVQMSLQRKEEILSVASKNGLYIIENDYENEINYPRKNGRPIFTLDTEDRSFYLGTFNRILHPSIRIGFVVVPRHLVQIFQSIVIHTHRFVSPNSQVVLRSFIEKKYLHEHLKQVTQEAAKRHVHFNNLLSEHLGEQLTPLQSDCPSLHITTLLNTGQRDVDVVSAFAKKGIIAHALSKCYISGPRQEGLIFGYSSVKPQYATRTVAKMAEIMHKK